MNWNRLVAFALALVLVIGGITVVFSGNTIGEKDETADNETEGEEKPSLEVEKELSETADEKEGVMSEKDKIQKQESPLENLQQRDSEPLEDIPEKVREKPPSISPGKRGSNIRESEGYEVKKGHLRERFRERRDIRL